MILLLDHHIIVRDKVEVPDRCPTCASNLFKEGALKHFEYQDQSRSATMNVYKEPGTHTKPTEYHEELEWGDDLPQSGDSSLALEWQCSHCGHVLAQANVRLFSGDYDATFAAAPQGVLDLLNIA